MDINARINWQPGMELTADTIRCLYDDQYAQRLVTVRASLGSARLGLVPEVPFNNKGTFVRNTFEMPNFKCMALLPSGKVIDADEAVRIVIPMLYGQEYYLTVSFGQDIIAFEHKGIPYGRPSYVYSIKPMEEITDDMFPVVRFQAENGVLTYDENYIPPTLQLADDERLLAYVNRYAGYLDTIVKHPNLDKDLGYRAILSYKFLLMSIRPRSRTHEFLMLTQEIVECMNHFIFSQVEQETPVEIQQPTPYDIRRYLDWVEEYLHSAAVMLDKVVVEDHTIDVDALKEQLMKELYDKLYNDLHEALLAKIKEELTEELTGNLQETLMNYINETLKPALSEELQVELSDSLYGKLYQPLYDALFEALNIPRAVEEEDPFMPLI